jgi:hypothetical protein
VPHARNFAQRVRPLSVQFAQVPQVLVPARSAARPLQHGRTPRIHRIAVARSLAVQVALALLAARVAGGQAVVGRVVLPHHVHDMQLAVDAQGSLRSQHSIPQRAGHGTSRLVIKVLRPTVAIPLVARKARSRLAGHRP